MPVSEVQPTTVCQNTVLAVRDLAKTFRIHENNVDIHAFGPLSFDAPSGKLVSLVGASGSGKSSVLKCIYRTYVPSAGSALYEDESGRTVDLATADELEILRLRRDEIRFVSQFLRVLPRQSSVQIVANEAHSEIEAERLTMAEGMLAKVGLPSRLWHIPPASFSGGERQILNLARALVVKPRLLLLDEPTASLDPRSSERVVAAIQDLKAPDLAMLTVFHDRRIVEQVADDTVQLQGGIEWTS